jgi:hypothetical protein
MYGPSVQAEDSPTLILGDYGRSVVGAEGARLTAGRHVALIGGGAIVSFDVQREGETLLIPR